MPLTPEQQAKVEEILGVLDWSDVPPEIRAELEAATLAGTDNALLGGNVGYDLVSAVNRAAADYAKDRAAELVGSGEQSIAETTRDKLRDVITQSFEDETGIEDLLSGIESSGIFSPARALCIARTEVNRAELTGNLNTWDEMGNVEEVDWIARPEACEECQDLADGGPYSLDEARDLLDDTHPNCTCGLMPRLATPDEE
jgi:hypothetical protein